MAVSVIQLDHVIVELPDHLGNLSLPMDPHKIKRLPKKFQLKPEMSYHRSILSNNLNRLSTMLGK